MKSKTKLPEVRLCTEADDPPALERVKRQIRHHITSLKFRRPGVFNSPSVSVVGVCFMHRTRQIEGCPQAISQAEAHARRRDEAIPGNVIDLVDEGGGTYNL